VLAASSDKERLLELLWKRMSRCAEALLECAVEITSFVGHMHSYGASPHYRRGRATGPLGACVCGEGVVWGQPYVGAHSRHATRVEYQCGLCGPVGDDDGRRLVRLAQFTAEVKRGGELKCVCECSSAEGEQTQIHLLPVLESWRRERRIAGEVKAFVLTHGSSAQVELSLRIPEDMVQGVYPLSVLGVVNGTLCIVRQYVQVLADE
jgi:hypothetical protein